MSELGPWVMHDGARPVLPDTCRIILAFPPRGIEPPTEGLTDDWPGWYWRPRLVRVGWFRRDLLPVCDDPAYAPIIRYRIRRPQALRDLIRIAENPKEVEPA